MKIGIMFSGQGSQYANMGLDIFLKYPEKVKLASEILEFDVLKVLENKDDELKNTLYTQTLMTLLMIMLFDELKDYVGIEGLLGFSLGEYSALYASGIYDFETILKLVKYRATLMDEATNKYSGKMAAVITNDLELLEIEINKLNSEIEPLVIANYNSKNQFVVSGTSNNVDKLIINLKEQGIRKIIPLNVSGAFHSNLMNEASLKLNKYLNTLTKNNNKLPIYLNTTAKPLNINDLESELTKQIKSSVYFYQAIEEMIKDGFNTFIEIGPGNVLTNLVKRNYDVKVFNIENLNDLTKWREENA